MGTNIGPLALEAIKSVSESPYPVETLDDSVAVIANNKNDLPKHYSISRFRTVFLSLILVVLLILASVSIVLLNRSKSIDNLFDNIILTEEELKSLEANSRPHARDQVLIIHTDLEVKGSAKLQDGLMVLGESHFNGNLNATGTVTASNLVGSFAGDGSLLTNLPIPTNLVLLQPSTTTSQPGNIHIDGSITADNFNGGRFFGDGSGLTNLPGLTGNFVALQDVSPGSQQTGHLNISGNGIFGGAATASSFTGNGASLTSLNASNVSSGTLADARLSANVALLNAANTFTNVNTFSAPGVALNVTNDVAIGGNLAVIGNVTGGTYNGQTISSAASFTGTLSVTTGYQIGGIAAAGSYLRGDGTNFVSSPILAADLPAGSGNYIQNGTAIQASANFAIQSAAAGSVGAVIRGAASQTADLLQLQNSSGTILAHVDANGNQYAAGLYVNRRFDQNPANGGIYFINATGTGYIRPILFDHNATALKLGNNVANVDISANRSIFNYQIGDGLTVSVASGGPTFEIARLNYGYASRLSVGRGTDVGFIIKGAASQTADLQQWQNSVGTVLARVDASGNGYFNNGSGGTGGVFVQGGNSFGAIASLGTNDAFDLQLETGGTPKLTIQNTTGNVGIGATSPSQKLEVSGNSLTSGEVRVGTSGQYASLSYSASQGSLGLAGGSSTWTFNGAHVVNMGNLNARQITSDLPGGGSGNMFIVNDGLNWNLALSSGGGIAFNPGGNIAMRLTPTGNVGIGTISPTGKLHVQGTDDAANTVLFAAGADTAAAGTSSMTLQVRRGPAQTTNLQEWQSENGSTMAYINNTGAAHFRIGSAINQAAIGQTSLTVGAGGDGGTLPLLVVGANSQFANLMQIQDSSGGILASIGSNGDPTFNLQSGSSGLVVRRPVYAAASRVLSLQDENGNERVSVDRDFTLTGQNARLGEGTFGYGFSGSDNAYTIQVGTFGQNQPRIRSSVSLLVETNGSISLQSGFSSTFGAHSFLSVSPTFAPTATSSATFVGALVQPTINFSNATPGAGNVTSLLIDPIYSAAPTGTKIGLQVNTGHAGAIGQIIRAAVSQTADLMQLQNSGGVVLASVTSSGNIMFDGNRDVIIQNAAAGNPYPNVSRRITLQSQYSGSVRLARGIDPSTNYVDFNGTGFVFGVNTPYGVVIDMPGTGGNSNNYIRIGNAEQWIIGAATVFRARGGTGENVMLNGGFGYSGQITIGTPSLSLGSTGTATSVSPAFHSYIQQLRGSYWTGSAAADVATGLGVDATNKAYQIAMSDLGVSGNVGESTTRYLFDTVGNLTFKRTGGSAAVGAGIQVIDATTNPPLKMNSVSGTSTGGMEIWSGGATPTLSAKFQGLAASPVLQLRGKVSQTGDLLQAQDSTGVVLAKIDAGGNLTVKNATFNGTLSVNGHIITGNTTGTTTIAAGAAACTAPTINIDGNDTAGTVTVTTGTGCAANGTLVTITFANSYGAVPRVILTPANSASAALQYYNGTANTTSFTIDTNTIPTDATQYRYNYQTMQ